VQGFAILHSVKTGSVARPATDRPNEHRGLFPSVSNCMGREGDRSPPSTARVKNGRAIPPLHHASSCLREEFVNTGTKLLFYPTEFTQETGIMQSAGRTRDRNSSPGESKIFLLSTSSRPVLGTTEPTLRSETWACSLAVNRSDREVDHSPSCAEVKNRVTCPISHTSSW
jgi:hypothetical protein